jgi:hypothetical protein
MDGSRRLVNGAAPSRGRPGVSSHIGRAWRCGPSLHFDVEQGPKGPVGGESPAGLNITHCVSRVSRDPATRRGLFLRKVMRAAREHDPSEAGGVRDALGTLQDFGQWPFAAIAVGLIAYGGYQLLNARYRRIRVR